MLPSIFPKNEWAPVLAKEAGKPYFKHLNDRLLQETGTVYPNKLDIFNALSLTAPKTTKIIILGQDPYHGPGQAHGLCFSVKPPTPPPPSLVNIFKELTKEGIKTQCPNGDLTPWAKQGVFLLNTCLTVRDGNPASHANFGWQILTDALIMHLSYDFECLVFILWGNYAKSKSNLIPKDKGHLILTAPHPSPLSAHAGFFGCNHFQLSNIFLEAIGKEMVIW